MTADTFARDTVAEVRDWLREHVDNGVRCPCCTQLAKVYRRKINASMAVKLIGAWQHYGGEWFYLPRLLELLHASGRDESSLRYWALIEESHEPRDDGGRAGWWRVTEAGGLFVQNRCTVPKYARVYDGRLLNFTGEQISIVDALGARFDYQQLMAGL